MALDVATFKTIFPEFTDAGDPLIALTISDAINRVTTDFGNLYDRAVAVMTARMLSQSSYGQQARLKADNKMSTYDIQWRDLAYSCNAGGTVL